VKHEETLNRIRWRCRRGLLELDLVLARFSERHLESLSAEELETFSGLLERPDLDLWELIGSAGRRGDEHLDRVLDKLRAS
jgi:antitoxin CptB